MPKHKKVGVYELKETLGRVKRGINTETGEVVAVKIININNLEKEGMEKQVKKEITVLKSITHPNVVKMFEVLKSANHIYIIMELVVGGELFDKIVAEKRFDEATARKFFHQLIDGISYCHAHNIAHRDLKPENLLLTENNLLKISDFGLSGIAENNNRFFQTICGTPHYVAPEVLSGNYDGKKADIWSCGIILFVMASGCHPFDGDTVNELFKRIENLEFKYPPYFSKELRVLLDKIIVVNPDKRATLEDIKNDKWFKVGYTPSASKQVSFVFEDDKAKAPGNPSPNTASVISDTDIENAVQETKVEFEDSSNSLNSDRSRSDAGALRQRRNREKQTLSVRLQNTENLNAFELFFLMMKNRLHCLLTREPLRHNHFFALGYPDDVYDELVKFIAQSKSTIKQKDTQFEFKAQIKQLGVDLLFRLMPINFELCIIEITRLKGSTLKYHELFRLIKDQYGCKTDGTSKPITKSATTSTKSSPSTPTGEKK